MLISRYTLNNNCFDEYYDVDFFLPRLLQQLIWNRLKQRGVPDFLNIVALIGKIYCRDFLSQLIVL